MTNCKSSFKKAEQGDAKAQICLGRCYYCGKKGVPQDYKQAVYWFRKAAEQNDGEGLYLLGVCYLNGKGVQRNYPLYRYWLSRSARNGWNGAILMDEIYNIEPFTDENIKVLYDSDVKIKSSDKYSINRSSVEETILNDTPRKKKKTIDSMNWLQEDHLKIIPSHPKSSTNKTTNNKDESKGESPSKKSDSIKISYFEPFLKQEIIDKITLSKKEYDATIRKRENGKSYAKKTKENKDEHKGTSTNKKNNPIKISYFKPFLTQEIIDKIGHTLHCH